MEEKIIAQLRTVFDPEMPVNIYDLGLIYKIIIDDNNVNIEMTLTSPNCPVVDSLVEDVKKSVEKLEEIKSVNVKIVFDPPWNKEMLSDEAKLELGLL